MFATTLSSSNGVTVEWVACMPLLVLQMICGKGCKGANAVVRYLQGLLLVHHPHQFIQLVVLSPQVAAGAVEPVRLRRLPVGKCQRVFPSVAWAMSVLVVAWMRMMAVEWGGSRGVVQRGRQKPA